jgi:hypothetical protein
MRPISAIEANFASAQKPTLRLTTLEVVVAPVRDLCTGPSQGRESTRLCHWLEKAQ